MSVANDILNKVDNIPLLSTSAMQLLEVISNPDHTLGEIVKIVECDSILTGQVLNKVNSAKFGLIEPITSVARSLSYLGNKMVVSIAISICAPQLFEKTLEGYEGGKNTLWEHSLKTAIASREVALESKVEMNPDTVYTAGLLHDIGKSVISEFMINSANGILNKLDKNELTDYSQGEHDLLGTDHCEVGSALARKWNVPDILVPSIAHHHDPENTDESDRAMVYAVHVGDIIAMLCGAGTGADSLRYELNPNYKTYFSIDDAKQEEILLKVMLEYNKTINLLDSEGAAV